MTTKKCDKKRKDGAHAHVRKSQNKRPDNTKTATTVAHFAFPIVRPIQSPSALCSTTTGRGKNTNGNSPREGAQLSCDSSANAMTATNRAAATAAVAACIAKSPAKPRSRCTDPRTAPTSNIRGPSTAERICADSHPSVPVSGNIAAANATMTVRTTASGAARRTSREGDPRRMCAHPTRLGPRPQREVHPTVHSRAEFLSRGDARWPTDEFAPNAEPADSRNRRHAFRWSREVEYPTGVADENVGDSFDGVRLEAFE